MDFWSKGISDNIDVHIQSKNGKAYFHQYPLHLCLHYFESGPKRRSDFLEGMKYEVEF